METMPELQEIKSEIGGVDFGAHGGSSASTTPQPHQNFQWDQYQYNDNLWSGVYPSSQAPHFLPSSSTPCPTSHHTLSNAEVTNNNSYYPTVPTDGGLPVDLSAPRQPTHDSLKSGFEEWSAGEKFGGYGQYGMLPGYLTPPDRYNYPAHLQAQPNPLHLKTASMGSPMQTPPCSPPMGMSQYKPKEHRLTREAMKKYLRERGEQVLLPPSLHLLVRRRLAEQEGGADEVGGV